MSVRTYSSKQLLCSPNVLSLIRFESRACRWSQHTFVHQSNLHRKLHQMDYRELTRFLFTVISLTGVIPYGNARRARPTPPSALTKDLESLRSIIDRCDKHMVDLFNEKKKKNILIYPRGEVGHKDQRILENEILYLFNEKLGLEVGPEEIDFMKVLGKNFAGPIQVGLTTRKRKEEILELAPKALRGSGYEIFDDYAEEVAAKRKELIPEMLRLRKEGHIATLVDDRLIVIRKTTTTVSYR